MSINILSLFPSPIFSAFICSFLRHFLNPTSRIYLYPPSPPLCEENRSLRGSKAQETIPKFPDGGCRAIFYRAVANISRLRKYIAQKKRGSFAPRFGNSHSRRFQFLPRRIAAAKSAIAPSAAAIAAGSGTTVSVRVCPSHAKLYSSP